MPLLTPLSWWKIVGVRLFDKCLGSELRLRRMERLKKDGKV